MCVSLRHGPRAPPLTYVATSTLPPPRLSLIALEIAHASTFRTRPICALPSPLTAQSIDLNSPRVMTANSSDRLGVFWHYPPKSSDLGGLATSQTPHIAPPVALSRIPSHVALAIASFFLPCGKSNHYRFRSHDRPILCVSCSPIRWSSSRAKSAVGEVSESCDNTDHDVSGTLAGGVVSAVTPPDLLSRLGAWVLVMCIGVVSRERCEPRERR